MWIELGPVEQFSSRPLSPARMGTTRLVVTYVNGEFGALVRRVQPRRRPARRGPPRRRLRRLPLAPLEVPLPRRATASRASRRTACRATRSRSRRTGVCSSIVQPRDAAPQAPARAAPAGAPGPSARPGRCACSASRPTAMDRANPRYSTSDALLGRRRCSTRRARSAPRRRLIRLARAQVPRLRGLLLEERARLHLALLDHADGSRATSSTASTRRSCTGPTSSSSRRRSAGARRARSTTRWSSG